MQSPKLEHIKQEHPKLRDQLSALANYIARQASAGRREIVPSLAAEYLKSSEAGTLGLLMLLENERLLRSVYHVYCRNKGTLLLETTRKDEIPEAIYCKFCGEEHADPDELEIELVFQIVDRAWEPLHTAARVS